MKPRNPLQDRAQHAYWLENADDRQGLDADP
jgi:hypothetical protein